MIDCKPHYRLYSESNADNQPGRWRFVLREQGVCHETDDCSPTAGEFEAGGTEEDVRGERLELLCVVRGLEALEQPSRVTLMTSSVYVREGIRYGLDKWRKNDWRWESFGKMVPVKNRDLWQRVDTALRFHRLECRMWRFDAAHAQASRPHFDEIEETDENTWSETKSPSHPKTAAWFAGYFAVLYRSLAMIAIRRSRVVLRRIIDGAAELKHAVGA